MVESGRVPGKERIRASTEKTVPVSTEKWYNPCEYRKIVESGRIPGKGRIGTSTEKLSQLVPENGRIRASIEKW